MLSIQEAAGKVPLPAVFCYTSLCRLRTFVNKRMRLAIWNTPAAEFLVSGLVSGAVRGFGEVQVEREAPRTCAALLREGGVDVALIETVALLRNAEEYDLLPGVALSSWRYPFARLVLRNGLGHPIQTVAFDPVRLQETLVARVVLREHYGQEPTFVPYPSPTAEALLGAPQDVSLIVGEEGPMLGEEPLALDLGQEWYELTNYPMVWGLFAARKGHGTSSMAALLVAAAQAAEEQRGVWVQAREMPPPLHEFYSDDLRVRLDDLAIASLTELRQYLFFYNVLDEIPDLPFMKLADEEEPEEGSDDE